MNTTLQTIVSLNSFKSKSSKLIYLTLLLTSLTGHPSLHAQENSNGYDHSLTGVWKTLSGDVFIDISSTGISYFEISQGDKFVASAPTCLLIKNKDLQGEIELSVPSDASEFHQHGDNEITYDLPGDLMPKSMLRAQRLPKSCTTPITMNSSYSHKPGLDFDLFWNNINENYAFMSYRGISQKDWQQVYLNYRQQALATKNGKKLFALFAKILQETFNDRIVEGQQINGDPHVVLTADPLALEWKYKSPANKGYRRSKAVLTNPLSGYLSERFDHDAFTPIVNKGAMWGIYSLFGKLKNQDTGYLLLNSMIDYHSDKSVKVTLDDFELQKIAVERWMKTVIAIATAHHLTKIIIDVRNNLGGYDKIQMQIASYFTDKARLVFSKQTRIGGSIDTPLWSKALSIWLEPHLNHYEGNVVVLISQHTVSAGDSFALTMSQLPNVRLVGEATAGALSDVLQKHTSNGWVLSLSDQIYHYPTANAFSYATTPEGRGIVPDYAIDYDAMSHYKMFNFFAEEDLILNKAMALQW